MKKRTVILLCLLIALVDLILEKPEGLRLVGIDIETLMKDNLNKVVYYSGSIAIHILSCTIILFLLFKDKLYYKSFFWFLLVGLLIITPLFYYFNIHPNTKGEDRILAISNVYYFLRSPIILIYTLPIFFLWSRKQH